jgi:ABC-type lipoprotein release transport system permease subunit
VGAFLISLFSVSTWRLAVRNVGRNVRRTAIVVTAVSVGLAGMLVAMAVNYGMIFEMVKSAIQTELAHVQIHAQGWAEQPAIELRLREDAIASIASQLDELRAWAPRIRGEGLIYSPRASVGVRVVAIDPEREARVSVLERSIVRGEYLDGVPRRVLIGERLADRLVVGIGDKLVLSTQDVSGEMTGEAFRVGGTFRTASRDLDQSAVFLRLSDGQRLFAMPGEVSEIALLADGQDEADGLKQALAGLIRPDAALELRTWKELRPFLVQMVDMFRQTGWIMYAAIFVAMAFGIANVLLMSVYERMREIGILSAIGMPPGRMVAVIVAESLVLTLVGVGIGLAVGYGAVAALSGGIDLSAYSEGLTSLGVPPRIVPALPRGEARLPVAIAIATAVVASLWPALHAVRTRPAEAVRHV